MALTNQETETLIGLLNKLKKEKLQPPHMPLSIWRALLSVVPMPSVEVIVTKSGLDFLLTYRQDKDWHGWHIPGGFIAPRESIQKACERVAGRELGIDVTYHHLIDAYSWPDSPYGNDLSLICLCSTDQTPKVGKFFSAIPDNTVLHHREFLLDFLTRRSKANYSKK
jgi:ADP-ribose pyrophosphatase YjhB (NUDIX family)